MTLILVSVLILLVGAISNFILSKNIYRAWASIISQFLASLLILAAVIPILLGAQELKGEIFWSYPVDRVGLHVDALGAFFLAFSLPFTCFGTVYALGNLAPYFDKKRHVGVHFAILNMVSLSYILIYTVENSLAFLLGWEIAALSAWLGVIWDYRNQKIRFAGFNYLVSTHLSLLFLIAAFMMMVSQTGSFDFKEFQNFFHSSSPLKETTFLLLLVAFGLKSAYFPFHTWVPRAEAAAPTHVAAIMSGVIHNAGIYGILRFTLLLGSPEGWMGWSILCFSTVSAFMGVLYTASQRDMKRLLGYSSTENVGIVGIGIGLGYLGLYYHQPILAALGFSGAILHVLNHALAKCLLFYSVGSVYRMIHTVDLEKLGGLIRKMPQTSFCFLLGGLAISAFPPLNGFVSEFLIYNGLFTHDLSDTSVRGAFIGLAAILAFVGVISALSITRVFGICFLGKQRDSKLEYVGEAPRSMLLTMSFHALGIIVIGLFPIIGMRWVREPTRLFLNLAGENYSTEPSLAYLAKLTVPLQQVGSGFLLFLFFIFALRKFVIRQSEKKHVTWGCGYSVPNSRMQYTGSSFSDQFLSLFRFLLKRYDRENLPKGPFPERGLLNTHYVDSVERRMFKVLGEGENTVSGWMSHLTEEPRYTFSIGLIVLLIICFSIVART